MAFRKNWKLDRVKELVDTLPKTELAVKAWCVKVGLRDSVSRSAVSMLIEDMNELELIQILPNGDVVKGGRTYEEVFEKNMIDVLE